MTEDGESVKKPLTWFDLEKYVVDGSLENLDRDTLLAFSRIDITLPTIPASTRDLTGLCSASTLSLSGLTRIWQKRRLDRLSSRLSRPVKGQLIPRRRFRSNFLTIYFSHFINLIKSIGEESDFGWDSLDWLSA